MGPSTADILLHPVRLRIVRALAPRHEATVAELSAALPDVAPATLYRHVRMLATSGLIAVAYQRPVRGAMQRRFRLGRAVLTDSDLAAATRDDHLRYFITFAATLIDDFAAYLARGVPNYARDGIGYRQTPLHLTDPELRRLTAAIGAALAPFAALAPSAKRKPRLFSTIVMPAELRRAR